MQLMAKQQQKDALECIRTRMQPLGVYPEALHLLASGLLCKSVEELQAHTRWQGHSTSARQAVLATLRVRNK